MPIIHQSDAVTHSRDGVFGRYYQLPGVAGGTTVAYAEFTGEHGQRTIGDHARIYYILEGNCEVMINGEKVECKQGDLVCIPPMATYNLWPKGGILKVLLHMDLLDLSLLPK